MTETPHPAANGGALPVAPQTCDPDLEAVYRLWIDIIREARMLGGRDAARRLWRQSPLPPLDAARRGKDTPDWVDSFLSDCTEPAPGARLKAEAQWCAYLGWCQPRGLEPITRKGLLLQLARHGLNRQKASIVYFLNLRLRVQ
jgi:hypothetical protein